MSGESAEPSARLIGGRYELEALIGKGGVGEVWRARHVALNSRVAIKFLQPASAQKESAKRRFTTEAQVTAQLKTPSAVQVFDFGVTDEGQPYLVMELLEGETLGLRLQRVKRLGVVETARVLGQCARALQRAHQLGIVHRDFKPDNIVIYTDDESREQVKVLDFGVAKLVGALEDQGESEADSRPREAASFTRTGAVLGTPLYMAPEQIRDATHVDLRVDIWAFGVVAFECLAGRPPFAGSTLLELFDRIQSSQRASASFLEPAIPAGFDAWFDVACAPDPARRFPNATLAWKQLTVALEIPGSDSSPSLGGSDPNTSSGERRVLVVGDAKEAEGTAATLEGAPAPPGELKGRTHDGGFGSLQRISVDELPALARRSVQSEAPHVTVSSATGARSRSSLWMAGLALVVVASAVAVWQVETSLVRHAPADVSAVPTTSVTVPAAPAVTRSTAPATSASASGAASSLATSRSAVPMVADTLPSRPASAHPAPSGRPGRASATPAPGPLAAATALASPATTPAPTAAPPPAPVAPAPVAPAPAPTDPGSYR